MSQAAAFWDASALVPLCVHEITSPQAQSHLRTLMPVVWWGSPVEVHSAIARLHRLGKLKDVEKHGALSRLNMLSQGWKEILPADQLRDLATRLLDIHDLRAADSLQLAAALTWCQQRPAKRNLERLPRQSKPNLPLDFKKRPAVYIHPHRLLGKIDSITMSAPIPE